MSTDQVEVQKFCIKLDGWYFTGWRPVGPVLVAKIQAAKVYNSIQEVMQETFYLDYLCHFNWEIVSI